MPSRIASILCVIVLAGLSAAAGAQADGDPASDVLLGANVFYPYTPPVPRSVQATLNAETAAAATAHFPIKVALIAAPTDLGVIPDLFGKPQAYADFLDQEISFTTKQRVLVVMAAGYGVTGFPAAAVQAAHSLAPPPGRTSTDLAHAAITAVARLASASGHPIKGVPGITAATSASSGSSRTPLLVALIVAAVLVAGGVIVLRRRQPTGSST